MEFILTHPDVGLEHIFVIFDGVPCEADSTHPWWAEIIDLVAENDPRVVDLFQIKTPQQPTLCDEVCDDPECGICYLNNQDNPTGSLDDSFSSPLQRPIEEKESQIRLNEINGIIDERESYRSLYDSALNQITDQQANICALEETIDYEVERSDFLEAALRNYTEHVYHDIQKELDARWPR